MYRPPHIHAQTGDKPIITAPGSGVHWKMGIKSGPLRAAFSKGRKCCSEGNYQCYLAGIVIMANLYKP